MGRGYTLRRQEIVETAAANINNPGAGGKGEEEDDDQFLSDFKRE